MSRNTFQFNNQPPPNQTNPPSAKPLSSLNAPLMCLPNSKQISQYCFYDCKITKYTIQCGPNSQCCLKHLGQYPPYLITIQLNHMLAFLFFATRGGCLIDQLITFNLFHLNKCILTFLNYVYVTSLI